MSTNISCPEGWSRHSELLVLDHCTVHIATDLSLKIITLVLAGLIFLGEGITLISRWDTIKLKKNVNIVFIFWALLQNIYMSLQPGLNLLLNSTAAENLGLAFVTHASAAGASGLVTLFIYFEVKLKHKASKGEKASCLFENKKPILISIGTVTTILFLVGPLISFYAHIPLSWVFWPPVILYDFVMIPCFCYFTGVLYWKISHKITDDFAGLARQLFWTGIICGGIGLFTGAAGIYCLVDSKYEWVFIRLSWLADNIFNLGFFTIRVRRPVNQKTPSSSKKTTTSTLSSP